MSDVQGRRVLLSVDDEFGSASVIVEADLTPKERRLLAGVLPEDLTREQAWHLLAVLTRLVADERAYERECQRRGLLL